MVMRLWAKRNDLWIGCSCLWLSALTVAHFGWPWAWFA